MPDAKLYMPGRDQAGPHLGSALAGSRGRTGFGCSEIGEGDP